MGKILKPLTRPSDKTAYLKVHVLAYDQATTRLSVRMKR